MVCIEGLIDSTVAGGNSSHINNCLRITCMEQQISVSAVVCRNQHLWENKNRCGQHYSCNNPFCTLVFCEELGEEQTVLYKHQRKI